MIDITRFFGDISRTGDIDGAGRLWFSTNVGLMA